MIVCLYIYRSHKTNNCALCISRALYVKNVIVYPISLIYLRKTIGENKLQLKNITFHFHVFCFETEIAKLMPCGCINFLFLRTFGSHGRRQYVFSCSSIHLRDALRSRDETD